MSASAELMRQARTLRHQAREMALYAEELEKRAAEEREREQEAVSRATAEEESPYWGIEHLMARYGKTTRKTIWSWWRTRKILPPPDMRKAGQPYWLKSTVIAAERDYPELRKEIRALRSAA